MTTRRALWWAALAGLVNGVALDLASPWDHADWQWWACVVVGAVAFNVLRAAYYPTESEKEA